VVHTDGEGHAWTDCAPLGTYTPSEANAACAAFTKGADESCGSGSCGGSPLVCAFSPESIPPVVVQLCDVCWGYTGTQAGEVFGSFDNNGCMTTSSCAAPEGSWQ
jgi:hypothetical protein